MIMGIGISGGGYTHPTTIRLGNGTAAAPTYSFSSDTATGVYHTDYLYSLIFTSNAAEKFRIDNNVHGIQTPQISNSFGENTILIQGYKHNGADVIGVRIDNVYTLSNASSKIVSFENAETVKAYISQGGVLGSGTLIANAAGTVAIVNDSADVLENNAGWLEFQTVNGTRYRVPIWAI